MLVDELERLATLRREGSLTEAEYEAAKNVAIAGEEPVAEAASSSPRPHDEGIEPNKKALEDGQIDTQHMSWKRRILISVAVLACGVTIGLILRVSSESGHNGPDVRTTGSAIAAQLSSQLADKNDTPVSSVDCPDELLVYGDSIDCTVYFSDGSFKSVSATWEDSGGHPKIELGIAK